MVILMNFKTPFVRKVVVLAIAAVAVVGTAAYSIGYPPPQRFLIPHQRQEFSKFKSICEDEYARFMRTGVWSEHQSDYGLNSSFFCAELMYRYPPKPEPETITRPPRENTMSGSKIVPQ